MFKWVALVALCGLGASASAELQSVEVGGELKLRIRGNLNYQNTAGEPARVLIPNSQVWRRPIGPSGLGSRFRFDNDGEDRYYGEMQTRLHVTSRFTDDVLTLIEFESYDVWGEDFRSNYVTGVDTAGDSSDVKLLQSYIEADNFFGTPLRVRLGRQIMNFGKGWLVSEYHSTLTAQSFDGIRVTYDENDFTVDAWWSKLAESFSSDDDIDFYGIYGTYAGYESVSASLYWMFLRDASPLNDTNFSPAGEWFEDLRGLDDYSATELHTIGTRLFGGWGAFDFDWELAYQFGDAGQQGFGFKPVGGIYGDDGAEFGSFGTDFEAGYTFDTRFSPRVYLGGAWYEGEDNRDISLLEFLNPFYRPEASVSFNRLFAHTSGKYSFILDSGQTLTNFQAVRLGLELQPTEKTELAFELEQFWVDEVFDRPASQLPFLSFWTRESDDDLGLQTSIWGRYYMTEDFWIRFRWEHLFTGEAISDGNFTDRYGLGFFQGSDDDDADYIEMMFGTKF